MGRSKGKGKKKKKVQNAKKGASIDAEPEDLKNAPHSFVFHRGTVGDTVTYLTKDFRKIMEPFTASSLRARKANSVKDFLAVAGVLHVSHMTIFTATEGGTYVKMARVPRGPTLYFKVLNYCLARDVISSLKKQLVFQKQFEHPPLVICNNFGGEVTQLKLMASMFQNMFPSINLTKLNLNNVRRCVLFNYNSEKEEIDVRHYAIKVIPVGLSKGVKKIVQSKVPNLARFDDISEFITKAHLLSESEAEDDPNSHVTLPQKISSRGNISSASSSIRLVEQGPRMTLQLLKVEDGFMAGDILYHRFVVKTDQEKASILKKRLDKRRIKEERKRMQEKCVKRKEQLKKDQKKKSLDGMTKKGVFDAEGLNEEEDDDVAWFKKEVGKDPEHDLFDKKGLKRKGAFKDGFKNKRRRGEEDDNKNSLTKKGFEGHKHKKGENKEGFKGDKNRRGDEKGGFKSKWKGRKDVPVKKKAVGSRGKAKKKFGFKKGKRGS